MASAGLLIEALIPVAVHWLIFAVHARPYRSKKLFDLAGQIAVFGSLGWSLLRAPHGLGTRHAVNAVLVMLWSVRLGWFLFARLLERKRDFRHDEEKHTFGYFLFTWTAQATWCCGILIPIFVANAEPSARDVPFPQPLDVLGWIVCLAGLALETAADVQKMAWLRPQPNGKRTTWIESGLWYYSRHPNYFGECLVLVGLACCYLPHAAIRGRSQHVSSAPPFNLSFSHRRRSLGSSL